MKTMYPFRKRGVSERLGEERGPGKHFWPNWSISMRERKPQTQKEPNSKTPITLLASMRIRRISGMRSSLTWKNTMTWRRYNTSFSVEMELPGSKRASPSSPNRSLSSLASICRNGFKKGWVMVLPFWPPCIGP